MSNLQILSQSIRTLDNLYSLKDLHIISGSESKHQPAFFIRLDTTQALVAEMQKEDPTSQPIKTLRGSHGGTYACKELVIAYAAWISPAFHLTVLRAFLNQVEQPQPALPKPVTYTASFTADEIKDLVWLLITHRNMNRLLDKLRTPLEVIGSNFFPVVHSHHHEYKRTYEECLPILTQLIEPLKQANPIEYERLKARLG